MASSVDFVVKNGLQVSTNLVVGTYTLNNTPVTNGAIISGSVGIGTFNPLSPLHVYGNIRITNTATTGGIVFSDGTFQSTATVGSALTIVDDGATNAERNITFTSSSGGTVTTLNTDAAGLFFNPLLTRLTVNNGDAVVTNNLEVGEVQINNATPSTSSITGAFQVQGGMGVGNGAVIAGNVGIGTTTIDGYTNNALAVFGNSRYNGNIYIFNNSVSAGIVFADGTFQQTASTGGPGSNITLSNDTSTNAPRYINFTSSTTGAVSTLYTSSPGLIYYPVTGNLVIGGNLTVSNSAGISTFAGNVGIGTTTSVTGYILSVNGALAATTKSFVIKHPINPNMKLQYASLEGPEHGVYVRGRLTGTDKIQLPDYWSTLVNMDTTTVNLTPIGEFQKLYVISIDKTEITIGCDSWFKKNIDCYYTVYAERRDVDKLKVEI